MNELFDKLKHNWISMVWFMLFFYVVYCPLVYFYSNPKHSPDYIPYSLSLLFLCGIAILLIFLQDDILSKNIRKILLKACSTEYRVYFLGGLVLLSILLIVLVSYKYLPETLVLMLICSVAALMAVSLGKQISSNTNKGIICLAILAIAILNWFFVSYGSYYDGVKNNLIKEASILYKGTAEILLSDTTDFHKQEQLKNLYSVSVGEIRIFKNGQPYYVVESRRNKEQYILEPFGENFQPIESSTGDIYEYQYFNANRPYPALGIIRALTFSACDLINIKPEYKNTNDGYFSYKTYSRSVNLWAPFWILTLLGMLILYFREKQAEANVEKEKALAQQAEAYRELYNFKLTYNKIQRDFKAQVSNSKGVMQVVQSTWDKESTSNKQLTWDEQEKKAAKIERHDIFNEFNEFKSWKENEFEEAVVENGCVDRNIYRQGVAMYMQLLRVISEKYNENMVADTFDIILRPWLEVMRNELKGCEHILDVSPVECSVSSILDNMVSPKAIPANIAKSIQFVKEVSPEISNTAKCIIVLSKLQSIVYNLISNSESAIYMNRRKLRKSEGLERSVQYVGKIWLELTELTNNNRHGLCITVRDNAGGFPDNILHKVYKEPVKTTKDNREFGEGTALIGFFVKLMGGSIKASNVKISEEENGALTKIFIPYV
jgi:signal transduction histidine kinase